MEGSVRILLIVWALALLGSCEKDELTRPTEVTFEFSMNVGTEEGKFLQFDEGDLDFGAIEFDGNREAGEDIFFVSEFMEGVSVDLDQQMSSEEIVYDVPQGVYERIRFRLGVGGLADGPMVRYEGIYESLKDGDVRVIIEITPNEPVEIDGETIDNQMEIVLKKDIPATVNMHFDPLQLFQFANSRQLESADVTVVDGEPIILITAESNTVIFNQILNRLERSITATFD